MSARRALFRWVAGLVMLIEQILAEVAGQSRAIRSGCDWRRRACRQTQ